MEGQRTASGTHHSRDELRQRIANIGRPEPVRPFFSRVREVVLIACSYRGGSTLLSEIFRHSSEFLHFSAEIHPVFRVADLGFPENGTGYDGLVAEHAAVGESTFEVELSHDVGEPAQRLAPNEIDRFILDLTWRLNVQWPLEEFSVNEVGEQVMRVLRKFPEFMKRPDNIDLLELFHLELLAGLRTTSRFLNPYHYDISPKFIRENQPGVAVPSGPHSAMINEIGPLMLARPWRHASAQEIETKSVVVKTASNVYRLPFIRAIFPNAKLKIIHLTRNPAAAINGLYDGWRSHWFYNQEVETPLSIQGYSDESPAGRTWWKFGFPPRWEQYADRPLTEVCAHQWLTAHQAVLDYVATQPVDVWQVRYEDLISSREKRSRVFDDLASWLGMSPDSLRPLADLELRPMNAVRPPRRGRWRSNEAILEPVIESVPILEMAKTLGYGTSSQDWW